MVLVMLWIVNVWLFLAGFMAVVGVEGIGKVWVGQVVPIARADT